MLVAPAFNKSTISTSRRWTRFQIIVKNVRGSPRGWRYRRSALHDFLSLAATDGFLFICRDTICGHICHIPRQIGGGGWSCYSRNVSYVRWDISVCITTRKLCSRHTWSFPKDDQQYFYNCSRKFKNKKISGRPHWMFVHQMRVESFQSLCEAPFRW